MQIDHIHFYVNDATTWRDWFIQVLGFQRICPYLTRDTHTEVLWSGTICFLLSSPITTQNAVADYLDSHPCGVADVAFQVSNIEAIVKHANAVGAKILHPIRWVQHFGEEVKTAQVQGWGDLTHTLIERPNSGVSVPKHYSLSPTFFTNIDHVVLNVAQGELESALAYYEALFGFQRQQTFSIRTDRSALHSQVLAHPDGAVQFPINEPASTHSQIQEFLDLNQGAGIQHIALHTRGIVETIAQLRQRQLSFLTVPQAYYDEVQQRPGFLFSEQEWRKIMAQEVLVDWQQDNPQALLLQTFTQPIFEQPTFFFELIERRTYWDSHQRLQAQGFGEGNFRALFEAIEREQIKRGSLR